MVSAQDISGEESTVPVMGAKEDRELPGGAKEAEKDSITPTTGLEEGSTSLPVGAEGPEKKDQIDESLPDEEKPSMSSKHTEFMVRNDKFPPKVTSEVEELAEGVTKQIIKECRGEKSPSRHSTCFLHYRTWMG